MSIGSVYKKIDGSWVEQGVLEGVGGNGGNGTGGGTSFLTSFLPYVGTVAEWAASQSYSENDLIRLAGTSTFFRCIFDHTSETPISKPLTGSAWTTYWKYIGVWGEGYIWLDDPWTVGETYYIQDALSHYGTLTNVGSTSAGNQTGYSNYTCIRADALTNGTTIRKIILYCNSGTTERTVKYKICKVNGDNFDITDLESFTWSSGSSHTSWLTTPYTIPDDGGTYYIGLIRTDNANSDLWWQSSGSVGSYIKNEDSSGIAVEGFSSSTGEMRVKVYLQDQTTPVLYGAKLKHVAAVSTNEPGVGSNWENGWIVLPSDSDQTNESAANIGGFIKPFCQISHGFVFGDAVGLNSNTRLVEKVIATNSGYYGGSNSSSALKFTGIVSDVIDADNFEVTLPGGEIRWDGHPAPFNASSANIDFMVCDYYLSAATSGGLTDGSDLGVDDVRLKVLIPTGGHSGLVVNEMAQIAYPVQMPANFYPSLRSYLSPGNAEFQLISGTAYFCYLGCFEYDIYPHYIKFYVSTPGTSTQTAEIGVFWGDYYPDGSSRTLTPITHGSDGTLDDLTTTGIKGNTTNLNDHEWDSPYIPALTYIYVGIRTAMAGNQPKIWGIGYDLGRGFILSTGSCDVLTGAGPFTGAIVAAPIAIACPDIWIE
jgi:hypothetical protein